jgi:hypothetical protein
MKTFAVVLCALVLVTGAAVPMVLAQDSSSPPAASPSTPAEKAPEVKGPDVRTDDAPGVASPRTGAAERTGFFGLSPTAAIIVSVAVLLIVILAIVAMTNNRGTTYVDRDRL